MDTTIDFEVQRLLDENEISTVLHRYMRGVDRCDRAAILSAFHSDAVTHHGSFGDGGPAAFADYVIHEAMPRYDRTMHYISNMVFDFDGDTAYVETYVQAAHMHSVDPNTVIDWFGGRFIDRWERRNGEWKVSERTVVHEWDDSQTCSEVVDWRGLYIRGSRSKEDPSYLRRTEI